jgi:hypothetical protein
MKVIIELELSGDPEDTRAVREAVYDYLEQLIDDDSLDYTVENPQGV